MRIAKINEPKTVSRSRRTNTERSAETRDSLTEAVIECLCELGYARTTLLEISRRSGITSGAMQHHYGGKFGLMAAALDKLANELSEGLDGLACERNSVQGRVRPIVLGLWKAYYGHPRYMAVWEIVVGSRGEKMLHDMVVEHRHKTLRSLESAWVKAFDLEDKSSEAARDAMHFALSFMRGSALLRQSAADKKFVERQLLLLDKFLSEILRP